MMRRQQYILQLDIPICYVSERKDYSLDGRANNIEKAVCWSNI